MSGKQARLFVGLGLPDLLAQQLTFLGGGIPGARWEPAEKLHLTLRFLGDVDGGLRGDIDDALREVRHPPFTLQLRGMGHFPPRGEPRSLWTGCAPCPQLVSLHAAVGSALAGVGLEPDTRNFAPHVTLARLKRSPTEKVAAFLAHHALWDAPPFEVTEFTLYSSVLRQSGSRYRPELHVPLRTDETPGLTP